MTPAFLILPLMYYWLATRSQVRRGAQLYKN
jgi:hypothetical protein